eukprot:scaffold132986_cov60-Phaeocystis_antarctica.AAC.5
MDSACRCTASWLLCSSCTHGPTPPASTALLPASHITSPTSPGGGAPAPLGRLALGHRRGRCGPRGCLSPRWRGGHGGGTRSRATGGDAVAPRRASDAAHAAPEGRRGLGARADAGGGRPGAELRLH